MLGGEQGSPGPGPIQKCSELPGKEVSLLSLQKAQLGPNFGLARTGVFLFPSLSLRPWVTLARTISAGRTYHPPTRHTVWTPPPFSHTFPPPTSEDPPTTCPCNSLPGFFIDHPINCHLPRKAIPGPLSTTCSPLSSTYFKLHICNFLYSLSHPNRM